MNYTTAVTNISFASKYGTYGVQANPNTPHQLKPLSLGLRVWYGAINFFSSLSPSAEVSQLLNRSVQQINDAHPLMNGSSPKQEIEIFFTSASLFKQWNSSHPSTQIKYTGHILATSTQFPSKLFNCSYETPQLTPLVISLTDSTTNLKTWAQANHPSVAAELRTHGALVFRNCGLKNANDFSQAFKAITGNKPISYPGDTPRTEVVSNIYTSTAVADGSKIPPHQECSGSPRSTMPDLISFFCITSPKSGTGQTLLADAEGGLNSL